MARSVSIGDMHTSSSPVVKNHDTLKMGSCSQTIPLPSTQAGSIEKKNHSMLISLDSPQSLSLSQPLPPIGSSSPRLSSENISTTIIQSHRLKGPKMLPALHTSSRLPGISSQPNIAGETNYILSSLSMVITVLIILIASSKKFCTALTTYLGNLRVGYFNSLSFYGIESRQLI